MSANGNISSSKIRDGLKEWICKSPFMYGLLSNPFWISILILTVICLLDLSYGKQYENDDKREIIQHISTSLVVIIAGIFLNNLTITKCISGKGEAESPKEYYSEPKKEYYSEPKKEPISESNKYDELLSTYV